MWLLMVRTCDVTWFVVCAVVWTSPKRHYYPHGCVPPATRVGVSTLDLKLLPAPIVGDEIVSRRSHGTVPRYRLAHKVHLTTLLPSVAP